MCHRFNGKRAIYKQYLMHRRNNSNGNGIVQRHRATCNVHRASIDCLIDGQCANQEMKRGNSGKAESNSVYRIQFSLYQQRLNPIE